MRMAPKVLSKDMQQAIGLLRFGACLYWGWGGMARGRLSICVSEIILLGLVGHERTGHRK